MQAKTHVTPAVGYFAHSLTMHRTLALALAPARVLTLTQTLARARTV